MKGLIGEVAEKAIKRPKIIKMITGGISHHFFSFQRYSKNSLNINYFLLLQNYLLPKHRYLSKENNSQLLPEYKQWVPHAR